MHDTHRHRQLSLLGDDHRVELADLDQLGRSFARAWCTGGSPVLALLNRAQLLRLARRLGRPRVTEAVALVASQLALRGELADQSIVRMTGEIGRFAERLQLCQVAYLDDVRAEHVRAFVDEAVISRAGTYAEPSTATRYLRRSAVRLLFELGRQLHLSSPHRDPSLDITLPPRLTGTGTRPLEDDEERIGRIWARNTLVETRWPAAWALGQATATTAEIPALIVDDIDIEGRRVWIHGSTKREHRWGTLTDWGASHLAHRIEQLDSHKDRRVVFGGAPRGASGQASTSRALYEVLVRAGLAEDSRVRAGSLPAWAGRKVLEQSGSIEAAAISLGVRSLDQAARVVRYRWR